MQVSGGILIHCMRNFLHERVSEFEQVSDWYGGALGRVGPHLFGFFGMYVYPTLWVTIPKIHSEWQVCDTKKALEPL
jgi:hypothetical protein